MKFFANLLDGMIEGRHGKAKETVRATGGLLRCREDRMFPETRLLLERGECGGGGLGCCCFAFLGLKIWSSIPSPSLSDSSFSLVLLSSLSSLSSSVSKGQLCRANSLFSSSSVSVSVSVSVSLFLSRSPSSSRLLWFLASWKPLYVFAEPPRSKKAVERWHFRAEVDKKKKKCERKKERREKERKRERDKDRKR